MTSDKNQTDGHLNDQALILIDAEIERSTAAKLPGIADHLRGLAELIRSGQLAVTKLDESGMTFQPTGKGDLASIEDLVPGSAKPARGQRLIIEEQRTD